MKKLLLSAVLMAVMLHGAQAATYYTQGTRYLTSGTNWNTERDGSGSAGNSGTYKNPDHDLVLQQPVDHFFWSASTAPFDPFIANSYLLENGVVFKTRDAAATSYATFAGGDITVDTNATVTILNAAQTGAGNSAGGFNGTANFNLPSGATLILDNSSSSSSGDFEFGLNVVGGGLIDLDFANANCNWLFSGLTADFTGELRGDTFNGTLLIADGTEATNAVVKISRSSNDKLCKLDLSGAFALGELRIDGEVIADGIYTYADLVATNAIYADNLIDNGGTVYVGLSLPAVVDPFTTYYSQPTRLDGTNVVENLFPTSGESWNQERAGTDTNLVGFSTTYAYVSNNIVFQDGQSFYYNQADGAAIGDWNANSYTVEGLVAFLQRDGTGATNYAYFNNGDITLEIGAKLRVANRYAGALTNAVVGGLKGSAKLNLPTGTILELESNNSSAVGGIEIGMDIVGGGDIDFDYSNFTTWYYLSGLSSNFTGEIRGDTFNNYIRLAAGNGAINATLLLGRAAGDRTGKLDMDAVISIGELTIDGETVTNGVYSYAELVAFGAAIGGVVDFSDNLIDNGGTIYVGQAAPEIDEETYDFWSSMYSLTGDDALMDANPDEDSLDNLAEYALGGNPTNAMDAIGVVPVFGADGAAFLYVYNRRTDAAARGLTYDLRNRDNLVLGIWTNEYAEVGTSSSFTDALGDEFESVTNSISMDGQSAEFTKLTVELAE